MSESQRRVLIAITVGGPALAALGLATGDAFTSTLVLLPLVVALASAIELAYYAFIRRRGENKVVTGRSPKAFMIGTLMLGSGFVLLGVLTSSGLVAASTNRSVGALVSGAMLLALALYTSRRIKRGQ